MPLKNIFFMVTQITSNQTLVIVLLDALQKASSLRLGLLQVFILYLYKDTCSCFRKKK